MSIPTKSILITGCSSGIGLNIAQTLHNLESKLNYKVFASCRKPDDVKKLQQMGLNSVQLDVTDSHSIKVALNTILVQTGGKLDCLVNNAGLAVPGAVEDLSKQALLDQFDTNVFGLLELTNHVLPIMQQQGNGKIIVISSVLGFTGMAYKGAYCASKHALEGLFDCLRLELANTNIKISIVQPGPITSDFTHNAIKQFKKHINYSNSTHLDYYQDTVNKLNQSESNIIKNEETSKKVEYKRKSIFENSPDSVSSIIVKILRSKKPKARYGVTIPTHFMRIVKKSTT